MFSLADSSPGTQYSVNATLFEWWWKSLIEALSATCTVLILYGFYCVLFLFGLRTLRTQHSRFLISTAWIMFCLGTLSTISELFGTSIEVRIVHLLVQVPHDFDTRFAQLLRLYSVGFTLIGDLIMALNNFVTDLVFLYRCYMIWGSRKKVLFLPGISMLATLVAECVSIGGIYAGLFHPNPTYLDPRIPAILGGVRNIILVGFTAGRIWYIRREAQICIPNTFRQRYDTAIIIILESGAIYVFCLIIWVTAESLIMHSDSSGVIIFQGVAQGLVLQAVNIVPTLILVRVGLGRSTEKNSPFSQELPALHQVPLISVARLGKSSSLPDTVQKESGAGVLHISPEE